MIRPSDKLLLALFCVLAAHNQTQAATQGTLTLLYATYNRVYFNGELPVGVRVVFETLPNEMGETRKTGDTFTIYIDPSPNKSPRVAAMTLFHEMVHIKLYGKDFNHGPAFQAEMQRLADAGAFRDLW